MEASGALTLVRLEEAFQLLQVLVYAALAILALLQWRKRPDPAPGWLAVAFLVLSFFFISEYMFPSNAGFGWVRVIPLAVLPLLPYALYRFMTSFVRSFRWVWWGATLLTAVASLGALTLRFAPAVIRTWVGLLVMEWLLLTGIVVVRLWRAGRGQPTIARRRMRTMSVGAAGLALAALVAGEFSGAGPELLVELLPLLAALLMFVAFAPPFPLRQWWRRHEEDELRAVELSLVEADDASEVADTLLERACMLVGGVGAVLQDSSGEVVASDGDVARSPDGEAKAGDSVIRVDMRSHQLIVFVSAFTPFFGREETDRLNALAALADIALERNRLFSDQRFLAGIVESSTDAIITKTLDGTITSWNRGAEAMYGYRADEVVGKPITILLPPGVEDVPSILAKIRAGEAISHYETRRRTKDGRILQVALTVSPVRDRSGRTIGASTIARDVTDSVILRAELAEQADMLDLAQDAIIARMLDGTITYWNLAAEERYGWSKTEALGRNVHELLHTQFEVPLEELDETLYGSGRWEGELRHIARDGSEVIVASRWALRRDERGDPFGVLEVNNDITHQKEVEEALRLAHLEADRANSFKTDFLSRISHELRTPLNAILGFAQLLELDELTPDQLDSAKQITKGGRRLLELVNDVLDISRIESGTLRVSVEPVPVGIVVHDAIELIRPLAVDRGIRLRADLGDEGERLHVRADQQRLGQALLNLLSNAVKYNVEGGTATVTAFAPDPEHVRIGVIDTGPGIDEDKISLLFTPFERLGAEQTPVEGTGLGLALSRSLVQAMGGSLQVDTMKGEGTTFWIELQTDAGASAPAPAPAARADHLRPLQGSVLYIEDNLSNLTLVERLLADRADLEVIPAMTGTLGVELAQQHQPDLILLDLHLPDLDGSAVLARLKKDRRTRTIPVVVLSADATSGQVERLLAAGADNYLTKPIDVQAFLDVVGGFLERGAS